MNRTLVVTIIAVLIIAALTGGLVYYIVESAPVAEKRILEKKIPVVDVLKVKKETVDFPLSSEGSVRTRSETTLSAEVSGRIIEIHPDFEIGGKFLAGDQIARLDPVNFETAVVEARSALADAELALVRESARGKQAVRDWAKIGDGKEASDLVLRKPFLASAEAGVKAAKARLARALTDLDRTRILAPYDCRVRQADLDLGDVVVAGTRLGVVFNTQKFMVRLPLSLDDYAVLPNKPDIDLSAQIGGETYLWKAVMMWDQGEVDQNTLSAYAIVEVLPSANAPARFKLPPPGIFVSATIRGAKVANVTAVPRAALRGRDQVLILNEEGELEFRTLKIARGNDELIYATSGLSDGEQVILTKLELPAAGMKLKVAPSADKEDDGKDH